MKGLLFFSFGTRGERGDMTNKADKLMKTLLNTTTIVIIRDRWMMPGLLDQLYDDDLTPYNKRVAANIKKSLKGTKRSMEPGKNAQWLKIGP